MNFSFAFDLLRLQHIKQKREKFKITTFDRQTGRPQIRRKIQIAAAASINVLPLDLGLAEHYYTWEVIVLEYYAPMGLATFIARLLMCGQCETSCIDPCSSQLWLLITCPLS